MISIVILIIRRTFGKIPMRCSGYDPKTHPVAKLYFWTTEECGITLLLILHPGPDPQMVPPVKSLSMPQIDLLKLIRVKKELLKLCKRVLFICRMTFEIMNYI